MGEECIFCRIAAGEIPSKKFYEDEHSIGFLDIYPAARGHSLVISKKHYATMLDIPEIELRGLIAAVQKVGAAAMKATKADGFNVIQNNWEAAGQAIHHIHFHVVPRFMNDGLKIAPGSRKAEEAELAEWQKEFKRHV